MHPETRYNIGYGLVLLTIQNIVVGLVIIAATPVRLSYLSLKKSYLMKQWRKRNGIKTKKITKQSVKKWFQDKCTSWKENVVKIFEDED